MCRDTGEAVPGGLARVLAALWLSWEVHGRRWGCQRGGYSYDILETLGFALDCISQAFARTSLP